VAAFLRGLFAVGEETALMSYALAIVAGCCPSAPLIAVLHIGLVL
jgi:hypothetical protein